MTQRRGPGRAIETVAGGAAPAFGKVMVAVPLRVRSPLWRVSRAFHGPSGISVAMGTLTGSVWPIPSVTPKVTGNRPVDRPPGPSDS